jgi:hypothetical protein
VRARGEARAKSRRGVRARGGIRRWMDVLLRGWILVKMIRGGGCVNEGCGVLLVAKPKILDEFCTLGEPRVIRDVQRSTDECSRLGAVT